MRKVVEQILHIRRDHVFTVLVDNSKCSLVVISAIEALQTVDVATNLKKLVSCLEILS